MSGAQRRGPTPRVTVAIANYNGRELLHGALRSLDVQTFRDFCVLVVDDGSTDDSVAWLRSSRADVEVIAQSNRGVTATLNVCLSAPDTALVMLLNNDVELRPDCVGELVAALDAHPQAGSACAKLLDFHRRDMLDGAGDVLTWAGNGHRRGQGEVDRGQYDQERAIFGACAAAAVYRRSALDAVGLFDEDFEAFFEDTDWALRAQLAGFDCRYVPSAVVYHMGSATLGVGLTDFTRYRLWRNTVWMLAKGLPASVALRHSPRLLLGQLLNLAVAVRDRKLNIWLRAWRDALRGLPRMLARRRAIQRARRVSPRELEAHLGPDG
ncbi:MAG TPA: glycosyltransferase family 2 protein [Solirubrobacteraceae bacterium]|nr:glycosyltransferase family 2 protein [Solirubrobacteraceae bacterium]